MTISINTKITKEQLEKEKTVLSPEQRESVIKELKDGSLSLKNFCEKVSNDRECVMLFTEKKQPSIGLKECGMDLINDKEFIKDYIKTCLKNKSDLSDIVYKEYGEEYKTLYRIKNMNKIEPIYCATRMNPKTNNIDVVLGNTILTTDN